MSSSVAIPKTSAQSGETYSLQNGPSDEPTFSSSLNATLGSNRRDRGNELAHLRGVGLYHPLGGVDLYAGAGSYLNEDEVYHEPYIVAGLKLEHSIWDNRVTLKGTAEGRHNLETLPMSWVKHQNFLSLKAETHLKFRKTPRLSLEYAIVFSNDFIPDGGTNYAQMDPFGRPRVVTTETFTYGLTQTVKAADVTASVRFEPDLSTPTSPDKGTRFQGAGLKIELDGRRLSGEKLKNWSCSADMRYHAPSALHTASGITGSLTVARRF